jgi:hypothetical protein
LGWAAVAHVNEATQRAVWVRSALGAPTSILGTIGARKLCGMTKTIIVAPVTHFLMSGCAMIDLGSLMPGR